MFNSQPVEPGVRAAPSDTSASANPLKRVPLLLDRMRPAARFVQSLPVRVTRSVSQALASVWVAAVALYLAAWALLSTPWLFGGLTIPYDAKAHFQAQIQFLATALHSGQSPFWTPNVFAGAPQIADPQSLIFSPALLIAIFNKAPSFTAVDLYVLSLLGAGGLAILLYVRDRGWHPIGAVVAGLMFAFGGSAAWRIQHIGQIKSYALFGIALFLLARTIERRSYGWAIATGLTAGFMIVEPDQVALLAAYVLAAYTVTSLWRAHAPWQETKLLLPVLLAAGAAALVVACLPILMTYLFLSSSNRPEIAVAQAMHGSLHPASLLTALIGDLYGAVNPSIPFWGPYSYEWSPLDTTLPENMSQVYSGALPVLLFLTLGVMRGNSWHPDIRFFTVAFVFAVFYALGGFTPLFELLYDYLPGVKLFRRPADATFLMAGLFPLVTAHLIHLLINGQIRYEPSRMKREGAVVGLLFVIAFLIAVHQGHVPQVVKPLLIASALLAASAGMAFALARYGTRHAFAGLTAVTALTAGDLWINNGPNGSTAMPLAAYDMMKLDCKNETIRLLKAKLKEQPHSNRRDRVELVGLGFEWPNISLVHGFEQVLGYNPLRLEDVTTAVGAEDNISEWQQRRFTPLFPSYRSMLADMLGVRYIVSSVPIDRIDKRLKPGDLQLIARTKEGFVYENPHAMPRVMFAANWQLADFEEMKETGKWPDGFDPTTSVLLENPPPLTTLPDDPRASNSQTGGTAEIERYENTVIEVNVEADRAGFLVMNGAWHPWWRATLDDKPTDILKANVMFRAVQVPPGRHKIRFEFEPVTGALAEIGRILAKDAGEEDDETAIR